MKKKVVREPRISFVAKNKELTVHIPMELVHHWILPKAKPPAAAFNYDLLTAREREMFSEIMAGKTYKEIAFDSHITLRTVKFHAANILTKIGLPTMRDVFDLYGNKPRLMPEQAKEMVQ